MKIEFQKIILLLVLALSFSVANAQNETLKLPLTLTVNNDKNFLNNFSAQNFEIYLGKKRIEIESFALKNEPISVGFLIDTSASMQDKNNQFVFGATTVSNFLKNANAENDYFVMTFDKVVKIVADTTQDQEAVKKSFAEIVQNEMKAERTEFYDAVSQAYEKIGKAKNTKKVLILITDAQNNGTSKLDSEDIEKLIKRENVLVYGIRVLPKNSERFSAATLFSLQSINLFERDLRKIRFIAEPFPTQVPRLPADSIEDLDELISITGGRVFYPINQKESDESFNLLSDELKNQYALTVKIPQNFKKSEFNEIKVKFNEQKNKKIGKVSIRTRKGFYF